MGANETPLGHRLGEELQDARLRFLALLHSLDEQDMHKPSLNPGWTNGEIMAHILFGFMIVNSLFVLARMWGRLPRDSSRSFARFLDFITGPFNWINAMGARGQARVFTYRRLGAAFERVHASLLRRVRSVRDEEWQRGMYYPVRWDPTFDDFMTLERLFRYPVRHFELHLGQIAPRA